MSTLVLIRHGQASFGAADYDQLSELGQEQSRRLGAHLAATGGRLDAVYSGPRKRQLETAQLMLDTARAGGAQVPAMFSIVDELDEFPFDAVLRQADLTDRHGFASAMDRWARGEDVTLGDASFLAFARRVEGALARIRAQEGRKKAIAVVTSAGPISLALKVVLELRETVAMKMGWTIANTSMTELKYRDSEMSLSAFNATPHLPPAMVTRL